MKLTPHQYKDKPKLNFGRDTTPLKPFFIRTESKDSTETIRLTEDEARHLVGVGWRLK
jgi:hypothetical protein